MDANEIKMVIFDMDGLMLDTERRKRLIWKNLIRVLIRMMHWKK